MYDIETNRGADVLAYVGLVPGLRLLLLGVVRGVQAEPDQHQLFKVLSNERDMAESSDTG